MIPSMPDYCGSLELENDELRAEIERLRAALEAILNAPQGPNLEGSIQAMRDRARLALSSDRQLEAANVQAVE